MRILSAVSSFFPYRGGSGLGHYDLLSRMVRYYGDKVDVLTYNFGQPGHNTTEVIAGMTVYRLSCWLPKGFVVIPRPTMDNLKTVVKLSKKRHDIVYTRARYSPPTTLGVLLAMLKRIPMIHTEVSIAMPVRIHWYSGIFAGMLNMTLGKWITCRAACVAVSQDAAQDIAKLGVRNVTIIYNGVDREVFHP